MMSERYKNISLERINTAHPLLREDIKRNLYLINSKLAGRAQCLITDVLRSFPEQAHLFAKGRTAPGKVVTYAKPGESYHNYGLAVDFCLIIDNRFASWNINEDFDGDGKAAWMEVVDVFKKHGWEWGGDWRNFKDYCHFQQDFGYSTKELFLKRDRGNVDAAGYVKI